MNCPAHEGRWCPECGGELRHARRVEEKRYLVTYLKCLFCDYRFPTMRYDCEAGVLEEMVAE